MQRRPAGGKDLDRDEEQQDRNDERKTRRRPAIDAITTSIDAPRLVL